MALYAAGTWERAQLYALNIDESSTELDPETRAMATASLSGQWVANTDSSGTAIVIHNLDAGNIFTVPFLSDYTVYGTSFDPAGTRLAFMELGPPGEEGSEGTPWSLAVVDLDARSIQRFEATTHREADLLPSFPIGWSPDGETLVLNGFQPYTEAGTEGVWEFTIPRDTGATSVEDLDRREVLPAEDYLLTPNLSRDATQLLYLNRDFGYVPASYEPMGYDLAVNQLWMLGLTDDTATTLVEETDGGALGQAAAWSPEGNQALFAQGYYTGDTFSTLTLKTVDLEGAVTEVGAAPLPSEGALTDLHWCTPEIALARARTAEGERQLYMIDLATGESSLVISADYVEVVGCVSP